MAWGQGLADGFGGPKYAYQLAARLGGHDAVEAYMRAHSGAVIQTTNGGLCGVSPEVPEATPTVMEQVDAVPEPASIELVLLNGGINDVSIDTILDPLTDPADLHAATVNACYLGMKVLLAKAADVFSNPNCRFVVTGYYPILSSESDLLSLPVDDPLGHFLGLFGLGVPRHLSGVDRGTVLGSIVNLALQFWRESDQWLRQATVEMATNLGLGPRMQFVASTFTEGNALFTSEPWLFGFGTDLGPEDEVLGQRTVACSLQYPGPFELLPRELCTFASVGHPNVSGATAIATAIAEALGFSCPVSCGNSSEVQI